MCGISAIFGNHWKRHQLESMVASQNHRGPDASGWHVSAEGTAGLGHNRLSIIDLSDAARQPMCDSTGRYWITFNGEIYNYLELRSELADSCVFATHSDTEVLLHAYLKWGRKCLDRLIGMFAFAIWDSKGKSVFGARDRFGVKPLHYHISPEGTLYLASEIKAIHAAGIARRPNQRTWANFLATGRQDDSEETFWEGILRLPAGGCFEWSEDRGWISSRWYDPAQALEKWGMDERADAVVADELQALLEDSVRLRFRSDVPVGICLSGGLDSSLLLGLVDKTQARRGEIQAFTFYCGDPQYDELPWVDRMLEGTGHASRRCLLTAEMVPTLAREVQKAQDEPYGGIPTLGMARVHAAALQQNVVVLLDGNGIDEAWAGYDYYRRSTVDSGNMAPVQGTKEPITRLHCLNPEWVTYQTPAATGRNVGNRLQNLQYRDICSQKIPRAMRFADRVSMLYHRELREPFLDHRIVELGLRQPDCRKISQDTGKLLPRTIAAKILPRPIHEAPKRPVQTPQREWLRGPLQDWVTESIEGALKGPARDWFHTENLRKEWAAYRDGKGDNSFFVWQWVTVGMMFP